MITVIIVIGAIVLAAGGMFMAMIAGKAIDHRETPEGLWVFVLSCSLFAHFASMLLMLAL